VITPEELDAKLAAAEERANRKAEKDVAALKSRLQNREALPNHADRHRAGGGDALPASGSITVKDIDGVPTATGVDTLRFSNGSVTDDGAGQVTIAIAAAGAAPDSVNYLVGTANATLSAEIVVGTTPGGELGGTWASPTVDAVHSGSAHLALLSERATQAIAAGTTIVVTDGTPLSPFTTSGNITNTAAPFIAAGRNGQLVIIRNDNGSGTLTISDTNIGAGGSLLRLSANTVTMAAGSSMALEYSSIVGAWVQLWYLALVTVTAAINTFTAVPTANDSATGASATVFEWGDGSTHNGPTMTIAASYTGVPTVAAVSITTGTHTGYPHSLGSPYTSGTAPTHLRQATRNGTRIWRLSATVNGTPLTSDATALTFRAPNYAGVSTQATSLTSAQAVALGHYLDTDPYATYASLAAGGASDKIWFGFVTADATLDTSLFFAIGGERVKFTLRNAPLSVTSTYLKVQNYDTYNSDISQLGTVTVVVQSTRPPTRRYIGRVEQGTQLSEVQIEALAQSDLTESPNGTWTGFTGFTTNSRMWLCLPSVVAAPSNYGLAPNDGQYEQAPFTAQAVQSVTNQYGFVDASVKNIRSDVTNLHLINLNGATSSTWALRTQAAAFNRRIFMGPHADTAIATANILTLDDVAADGDSILAASVAGAYTVIIGASKYLWFCHPSTVADLATIKDNSTGFAVAGSYRTNVSHTTDTGEAITMRVWRSDNVNIFPASSIVDVT